MKNISPCLWFENNNAEEAVNFYVSVFKGSKIKEVIPFSDVNEHGKTGSVMFILFELNGQEFCALNGGKLEPFNHAISLAVPCDNQQEIDEYWDKLIVGGKAEECGWLEDKYGVRWQVFPHVLPKMMNDKDKKKAGAATKAMMEMVKIDLAAIEKAYKDA